MADPLITPLIVGAVVSAVAPTTVKWRPIEAWIESKRPGLKTPKGKATVTWEKSGKRVIVTAAAYSLVDPFLPGKPKPRLLDSQTWSADRLDPALARKFNGKPSFSVQLTRPAAKGSAAAR